MLDIRCGVVKRFGHTGDVHRSQRGVDDQVQRGVAARNMQRIQRQKRPVGQPAPAVIRPRSDAPQPRTEPVGVLRGDIPVRVGGRRLHRPLEQRNVDHHPRAPAGMRGQRQRHPAQALQQFPVAAAHRRSEQHRSQKRRHILAHILDARRDPRQARRRRARRRTPARRDRRHWCLRSARRSLSASMPCGAAAPCPAGTARSPVCLAGVSSAQPRAILTLHLSRWGERPGSLIPSQPTRKSTVAMPGAIRSSHADPSA